MPGPLDGGPPSDKSKSLTRDRIIPLFARHRPTPGMDLGKCKRMLFKGGKLDSKKIIVNALF